MCIRDRRKPARDANAIVVSEGYMDVIALHQAGITHAVASLGTALTEDQIKALWRMAAEPILCFDGDAAGARGPHEDGLLWALTFRDARFDGEFADTLLIALRSLPRAIGAQLLRAPNLYFMLISALQIFTDLSPTYTTIVPLVAIIGLSLLREAVEAYRETLGDLAPQTLSSMNNLASLLHDKGDLAAAEPLMREALQAQRETLGDRHANTLISIDSLAALLKAKGDLAAAEPLLREALQTSRETLGDRHPDTLLSINNLGMLLKLSLIHI